MADTPLNDQDLARQTLRDIVTSATTREWGYCPNCRKKVQTDVDDAPARVNAAKALLGKDTDTTTIDPNLDPAQLTPQQRAHLKLTIDQLITRTTTQHENGGDSAD